MEEKHEHSLATRHNLHMMYPKSYLGFINTNACGGRNGWEDNRVGVRGQLERARSLMDVTLVRKWGPVIPNCLIF